MSSRAFFNSLVSSLAPRDSFAKLHLEDGYSILPLVHPSWKESEYRLLIVLETLDISDIRANRLLTDHYPEHNKGNPTTTVLKNLLRLSWRALINHIKEFPKDAPDYEAFPFSLAVVNFNARKMMHLEPGQRAPHYREFTDRCNAVIKALKPSHVLISGSVAANNLLPNEQNLEFKCGWVFDTSIAGHQCLVSPTLDIEPLYSIRLEVDSDDLETDNSESDQNASGDLLYYVQRNLTNLMAGKHLYSLARVKPRPHYIDTLDKFKVLFARLKEEELIAWDIETANLESYKNAIYTSQFAFSWKESFVVPMFHPKTPFSSSDLEYIKRALTALMGTTKWGQKTFIVKNGKFDARIARAQFGIRFIPHIFAEIEAGEHLLDENMSLFAKLRFHGRKLPAQGNLQAVLAGYNNDFYLTAAFSKSDRTNIGSYDCDDADLLSYCAMDVQCVYGMYLQQRRRARAIRVVDPTSNTPTSYLPFFERHFSTQMNATVHALSSLEQNGSYVDTGYMQHLLGQHSPLKKILSDVQADSQKNELIQRANEMLLESKGAHSNGLFGKKPFVFEWSKDEGKMLLFIKLMGLKPLRLTKTKQPAIDKFFIAHYEKVHPEVVLFSRFQRATKLLGTYVRGWHRLIMSGLDSAKDHKLRASYDFLRVVTGRLSSFDPNLQQVPSRGELVKIIKRMFVAQKGFLGIRFDYSAHEVRVWSIIACDAVLATAFKVGQELRKEWIKKSNGEPPLKEEEAAELTKELKQLKKQLARLESES